MAGFFQVQEKHPRIGTEVQRKPYVFRPQVEDPSDQPLAIVHSDLEEDEVKDQSKGSMKDK